MMDFKKFLLFVLLIGISFHSFSQVKKNYYYDENRVEITYKEYDKRIISKKYGSQMLDVDSAFVVLLFQHKIIDNLNKPSHLKLNQYISELYQGKIDTTKALIIYFLPFEKKQKWKEGRKRGGTLFEDEFLGDVKNDKSVEMLWIYQPETENMEYYHIDKIPWKADSSLLIQRMFFPIISMGSVVALKPNGDYLLINGLDGVGTNYKYFRKQLKL